MAASRNESDLTSAGFRPTTIRTGVQSVTGVNSHCVTFVLTCTITIHVLYCSKLRSTSPISRTTTHGRPRVTHAASSVYTITHRAKCESVWHLYRAKPKFIIYLWRTPTDDSFVSFLVSQRYDSGKMELTFSSRVHSTRFQYLLTENSGPVREISTDYPMCAHCSSDAVTT
jgi:hypothetical protein